MHSLKSIKRYAILIVFIVVAPSFAAAQTSVRQFPFALKSGWLFYAGDAKGAENIAFDDSGWEKVSVPHNWRKDPGHRDYYGYAWYRLRFTIKGNPPAGHLGIKFIAEDIDTTYFNGVRIGSTGSTEGENHAYDRLRLYEIPPNLLREENVIAIRVYSSTTKNCGLPKSVPVIGIFSGFMCQRYLNELINIVFVACFLIIALYHGLLFIRRTKVTENLFFAMMCLCISIFSFLWGQQIKYDIWDNFFFWKKLEYLTNIPIHLWAYFFFFTFFRTLSVRVKNFQIWKILGFIITIPTAISWLTILFSSRPQIWDFMHIQIVQPTYILSIPSSLGLIFYQALVKKNRDARFIIYGLSIFVLTAVNDVLITRGIVIFPKMMAYGFFVFICSIALTSANRFARLHEEIRGLKNYLTNIIDSMPSLIIGVDRDGTITQWNQEADRFAEIQHGTAVGMPVLEALPWLRPHEEKIIEAISAREIQKTERITQQIGGMVRILDLMVYPLTAEGVEGAVIRIDDVTSRVRIEEMMVQTEKMMSVGGLAAGMAHEINNPLGGILLGTSNIMRRVSPDLKKNEEVAATCGTSMTGISAYLEKRDIIKMVTGIQEMAERAARIVSNMLGFSRKSEAAMAPSSLTELIDKAAELAANDYDLKKNFDFRKIRIVREYEPGMPDVLCNGTEIEQVILNLLKNAAHAMAGAGIVTPRITLRVKRNGGMAQIEVEDNGPGMSEEVLKRSFEPFFTTKEVGIGTGLGLSVSHHIITGNHKGEMAVQSGPGRGARFIIRIPVGEGT